MDNMKDGIGKKAKLKAILDIIDQMDEMELEGLGGMEEEPVGVTMVSVKKKKPEMMGENGEYSEEPEMEKSESMAGAEMPEEEAEDEEEYDQNSALGKLRMRLKGIA